MQRPDLRFLIIITLIATAAGAMIGQAPPESDDARQLATARGRIQLLESELATARKRIDELEASLREAGLAEHDSLRITESISGWRADVTAIAEEVEIAGNRLLASGSFRTKRRTPVAERSRLLGLHAPDGWRIAQVDVTTGGTADIFADAGPGTGFIRLVNTVGTEYAAAGFAAGIDDETIVDFDPTRRFLSLRALPPGSDDRGSTVILYFIVPEGVTLSALRVGRRDVLTCRQLVGRGE